MKSNANDFFGGSGYNRSTPSGCTRRTLVMCGAAHSLGAAEQGGRVLLGGGLRLMTRRGEGAVQEHLPVQVPSCRRRTGSVLGAVVQQKRRPAAALASSRPQRAGEDAPGGGDGASLQRSAGQQPLAQIGKRSVSLRAALSSLTTMTNLCAASAQGHDQQPAPGTTRAAPGKAPWKHPGAKACAGTRGAAARRPAGCTVPVWRTPQVDR